MTRLLLLTTGDTIAFDPRPGRGAFASGAELLAALPAGSVPADVTVEDTLAEPSWDLDPETMLRLARRAVVACLNDELHAARWVGLVDAGGVAAFSSAPYPLLGRVVGGGVELLGPPPPRPPAPTGEPESAIALIKTYPGIGPALLHAVADGGARGVVLEGTGMANVPVGLLTAIDELTGWDIPVVVSSRCRTRAVSPDEFHGGAALAARMGAISARGLPPVKARAALMVAVADGGVRTARDWFGRLTGEA
ncbi:asparaginase [Micromonospora sp. NBC_01699]|uniref:asparaginase n=1 Tax=Micromonospora sp. NBC_01699 TaxID=2975984 RepID=UPI002E2CBFFD|nr:asparaginase domain-containing protein [Micromonospora sp. NBC_01699]